MIPVGYMAKRVCKKPDWLKAPQVTDIFSVSGHVSKDFADYVDYWKHNGYFFLTRQKPSKPLPEKTRLTFWERHFSFTKRMKWNLMVKPGIRMYPSRRFLRT